MNHIMAVCDANEEYASRLVSYFNLKEGFPFQVCYFSTVEKMQDFAAKQKIEVVLISEEYFTEQFSPAIADKQIILSKNHTCLNENHIVLWKYQSCENIIKQIMQILSQDSEIQNYISRKQKLKVIGLYSPVKRSFQTSFAFTMGQLLAKRGKVLYLNLEGFSGLNILLKRNFQKDLSDILYYSQNGQNGLTYFLGSIVECINGMDLLPPMFCQIDLISITAKEWIQFFYEIENGTEYEYLILDLSDSVQGLFEILRHCCRIYTMTGNDGFALAKIDQYEKMLKQCQYEDVIEKTNKCTIPEFTYLPERLDKLTNSELAAVVKEYLKEDMYAVR